jgi:putative Mn2+ efflux pump MntP
MTTLELLLIAFGLSMDCFAVAISVTAGRHQPWKNVLLMAFLFGFFQGFMPVIGWFIGESLNDMITSVDHWLAFGCL